MHIMLALHPAQLVEPRRDLILRTPAASTGAPSGRPQFERLDSAQMSVNGIVLSRLTHLRDPGQITALVDSPYGMALLSRLMALYNGAALTVGTAFTQSNTITLFRMSGSTLSRAAAYGGTVLRDRLPHYAAKLIYSDLLEVITAVRTTLGIEKQCALLACRRGQVLGICTGTYNRRARGCVPSALAISVPCNVMGARWGRGWPGGNPTSPL